MLLGTSHKYSIKVYHICIMPCLIVYACAGAGTAQNYSNLLPTVGANKGDNKLNRVVASEGKSFPISSSNENGAVKIDDTEATHIPMKINASLTQPDKTHVDKGERNGTKNDYEYSPQPAKLGYDALRRLMLVSVGITAVVFIYCTIQYIRLRRKKTAALKYGLLASHDEDLEMTPLGDEEEDETTLFDMKNHFVS